MPRSIASQARFSRFRRPAPSRLLWFAPIAAVSGAMGFSHFARGQSASGAAPNLLAAEPLHLTAVPSPPDRYSSSLAAAPADSDAMLAALAAAMMTAVDDSSSAPTVPPPSGHLRSWELPTVRVEGQPAPSLREDELVGSYAQPLWTTRRRFASTRVYVIPEGKVEVEGWVRSTISRDDGTEWRFLQEVEIGLPYRFQFDFYLRQDYATSDKDLLWGGQFEVRWALADWGQIWGNPTLYFEYLVLEDRPDKIEPKILFGDSFGERWHWAVNLVAELELSGEEEHEYQVTTGLSYTVVDNEFSIGLESILSMTDTNEDRGKFGTTYVIGPDFQWKPVAPLTINFAPLIGVTGGSPGAQIFLNVGWEF